jgi:hypothetical protein
MVDTWVFASGDYPVCIVITKTHWMGSSAALGRVVIMPSWWGGNGWKWPGDFWAGRRHLNSPLQ